MFPLICPLLLPPKFNPHIVSFEKVITAGIARTHSTKIRFFFFSRKPNSTMRAGSFKA
jgi:hypothetical protein